MEDILARVITSRFIFIAICFSGLQVKFIPCSLFGLAILIWTSSLSFNGLVGCSRLFLQGLRSQVGRFVNSKAEEYIVIEMVLSTARPCWNDMDLKLPERSSCYALFGFSEVDADLCRDFLIDHGLLGVFLGSHSHWIVLRLHVVKNTLNEIDIASHLHERYSPTEQIVISRTQDDSMTILIPRRKRITHSPDILLHKVNHPPPFVLNELPLPS